MLPINRAPRVLARIPAAPPRATLTYGNTSLSASFDRLFDSIRPSLGPAASAAPEWHIVGVDQAAQEINAWDLCHSLVRSGFGIAGMPAAQFAEPDFEQQWVTGASADLAFDAVQATRTADAPDSRLPAGSGLFWFRDDDHSQLEAARDAIGRPPDRVRIAHLDTGYDPDHQTLPQFLRRDLQKNFVDPDLPDDAADHSFGILTNLGHGAGTLSLLAGAAVDGTPLGGAPFLDVIPIRVANAVVLFSNSAVGRAFDYVYGLYGDRGKRAHVITMSMGGLASHAWTDAVNALYDLGVFIVTAAGNNFGALPVRSIVYPARYSRVVAACGVMADGRPYADLPLNIMAGNYGPARKMAAALAGYTPNTPWARLGGGAIVDHDGRGTSAATPQVAAAAALWIQKFKAEWEAYPEGWMRVESVRKALFDSARLDSPALGERLGRGALRANAALSQQPAPAAMLRRQPEDAASFPFLRVLTGLGAAPDARRSMLELEALQISQRSADLERLLPDPENPGELSAADRQRVIELLHDAPGASKALRSLLEPHAAPSVKSCPPPVSALPAPDARRLELAMHPPLARPLTRKLRVFAFDPLLGYGTDFLSINQTTLQVKWEELEPGPVGEYIEVIDADPATGCCYSPADLDHPFVLSQEGFAPSEADPRFHQQMAYAVAMKTIHHFERALGRVALWAPRLVKNSAGVVESRYVRRLRIYPHAIREANSYYSPAKKALLLGYFPAADNGANLPGGAVFCCLSHDIVAHETTHALLDGLHRYFGEPSNSDVAAFHEAFADIVALFQHFTVREALRDQIARTRGDLFQQNLLGQLALQFGEGIGQYGALRSAIGRLDKDNQWRPAQPARDQYRNATEAHERGAVLVAAVFDAFLDIYRRRSEDLIRLATGGTGVLPPGAIPGDLVNRLAGEAAKSA
ncbi:MAG TPA: S8 family serine peptidase, partial [Bryobacteraceae bacterium]|nr:S8 family serine peptidase [Bryobacteraceae bacterium]